MNSQGVEARLHALELTIVGDKIVLFLRQFYGTFALRVAKEIKFASGSNGMGRLSFVKIILINGGGVDSTDEFRATGITSLPFKSLVTGRGSGI